MKVCEIPLSAASKMDSIDNNYIKKFLGLPHCASNFGLFGKDMLQLRLKHWTQGKAGLFVKLSESTNQFLKNAKVVVHTGHKWRS